MKIVLIGSTGHTKYVVNGLKDNYEDEIVAIAPGSEGESVEDLYQKLKLDYDLKKYDDYIKMLDELKPDVAAVACHFGDHARAAVEVLKRNIDLFVEKPIATTLAELAEVKSAYEKSDSKLAAMFGIRYKPWFLTAYKYIKEGAIGEVRLMNAQKSYRLGQREDFYKKRETYGGTIPWVGSHAIDWMQWLSGKDFKSVYASHSTIANQNHGELEVSALCHFDFEDQAAGSVNIDYLRPQNATSHDDDRIRIAGDKGVIEVLKEKVYLINDEIEGNRELPLVKKKEIFADFLDWVKGNGDCMITAEESFRVTEAALQARRSADQKKLIQF
ncbi:putative dehydrogenase [Halanaerobium saccharolyticum]|jgi:predicted dehydrogenase|uniref:Putative dehydrogenase n=1 Tax=Halanaerobium saccharolyticum TaxID=43595 RepID=A0A2T5RN36_9FIRM|nr:MULTISPECIES: Gfo/Idh/MocA family oxidoreductase [Halanaerobium]PTW00931.1 putative dehydrogenase [Halanaerobium saccharolyticum]PUU93409.1 MAG: oxidoreductase domain-containing protein [Halanaerobium sp.]